MLFIQGLAWLSVFNWKEQDSARNLVNYSKWLKTNCSGNFYVPPVQVRWSVGFQVFKSTVRTYSEGTLFYRRIKNYLVSSSSFNLLISSTESPVIEDIWSKVPTDCKIIFFAVSILFRSAPCSIPCSIPSARPSL